jgi:hypothetical protein
MYRFLLYLVCISLLLMCFISSGCEPYKSITINNNTSFPVQVDIINLPTEYSAIPNFIWDSQNVIIQPGSSQEYIALISQDRSIGNKSKYTVIAINDANINLFFHVYTWDELNEMGWRVVISQQEKETESNNATTSK